MSKSKGLSRDQKRRAKLKKRAERSPKRESLAYSGSKYKTEEFVTPLLHTEMGIYEAFVMTDRQMTDDAVVDAIEELVAALREGPLPRLSGGDRCELTADQGDEDLVLWSIRRRWGLLAETQALPRREDLVGILRTLLHSIDIWHGQGVLSQGYLRYLEGFMHKVGFTVQRTDENFVPLPEPAEPFLDLGRAWTRDHDRDAGVEFRRQAEEFLAKGAKDRVIEVCQQLIGETGPSPYLADLQSLILRGHCALESRCPAWDQLP